MKITVSGSEPLCELRQVLLDIMELPAIPPACRVTAEKFGDLRTLTFSTETRKVPNE